MIKRFMKTVLTLTLSASIVLANTIPARANGFDDFINEAVIITESALESYESSVIARMVGRAGASTQSGSQGIAFEVLYMDSSNLKNHIGILKPSTTMKLSESSIDDVADLILVNSDDEIVGLIQCKDAVSSSGVRKVIEQVVSGKYDSADLVGTTECAKAFNTEAERLGIDAKMIDSGISNKTTKAIAEKALGTSVSSVMKKIASNSAVGGTFSGAISLIESKFNGDDDATTLSHTTTGTANGALSAAAGTLTTELVTAGFVTIGASGGLTVATVFVAGIAAGTIVYVALEKIEDALGLEEKLTTAYDKGMTKAADAYVDCEDAVKEGAESTKKTYKKVKKIIKTGADDDVEFYANLFKNSK